MKLVSSTKASTRQALIEGGVTLMREHGYSNTGIVEVLNHVGVPKGSFYHHFESKEQFGCEIISYFEKQNLDKMSTLLQSKQGNALTRLHDFFIQSKDDFIAADYRSGCLIGNLGQEMADHSEILRAALAGVMANWKELLAECISEAQENGLISASRPSKKIAELLLLGWEGALLSAKLTKTSEPLDTFIEAMFQIVLV